MKKIKSVLGSIFSFAKRHKIWSVILLLVLMIGVFFLRPKPPKEPSIQRVLRGELVQSISITGTIASEKSVDLAFQTGGTLSWLGVKKGDMVTQNQTIATLDQRTTLKNLKTALLNYSIQRNTFEQTNQNQQAATPTDALNITMRRILENNQYNLDLAVNSVELQDLARQQSILTTPVSGIVTRADVKTSGVNITPATVFTVVDPQSLSFRMEVDEADISKVKLGQKVEINLDSYPNNTFTLQVDQIDFVTHTTSTGGNAFDVKAHILSNENYRYRVGMNGNATIITNKLNNVIQVPLSSLIEDNKVFVKTGKAYEKRTLKLGAQNDTDSEVVSGLSEGDLLVLNPSLVPTKK
jgi:RND family efflux transporter MFP subunit